jgi:probable phosphoglycerate mutase
MVAHAGTNSVLICHLLGLDPTPWEWERFVIGHASVTRLVSTEMGDGHTFCLNRLSDHEHLPNEERTF